MNKFSKIAVGAAAALTVGAHGALAAPTVSLQFDAAGALESQCDALSGITGTAGTGNFVGTTCTFDTLTGVIPFQASYGSFIFVDGQASGEGTGILAQPAPGLWLDVTVRAEDPGTLTVKAMGSGYETPSSPFGMLSAASGTNTGPLTTQSSELFFDEDDTGLFGAGVSILASGLITSPVFALWSSDELSYPPPSYGLSWVWEVTRTSILAGTEATAGSALQTFEVPLPGPAGLGLLGMGLLGAGLLRRRKAA